MKKTLTFAIPVLLLFAGCQTDTKKPQESENLLLSTFNTPFEVPPFDGISLTDYAPAFDAAIAEKEQEIDKIVNNSETPTFENTIVALDDAGESLGRISAVLFNLNSAETSEEMQAVVREIRPKLTALGNEISMNDKLFQKIKTVYDNRNNANLTPEQIRVTEKFFKDFERGGANLPAEKKAQLKEINQKLAKLYTTFGENLLAETNSFEMFLKDKADLAGLPEWVVAGAADAAKNAGHEGEWLFTVQKPSMLPFLQYSDKRELREKLYKGYFMRGDNNNKYDNKSTINAIVNLRVEKAKLLGFEDFAQYKLDINMAKNSESAYKFLMELWEAALPVAKQELAEMQALADKEKAGIKLASWDWWYYAEKVRKAKYALDDDEIKPYFSYPNVRQGAFDVATKLYGITFEQLTNLPLYHKDAETWEVKNSDGTHLGIVYLDIHPRPGKRGGAWCTSFRSSGYEKDGSRISPVVTIVCNFTPPSGDNPALLSFDETETFFHEFGHGLHGLFSDGNYNRVSGDMPRDMVELPSQIMENWAADPEVMKVYAKHYKTGEPIPDELIAKIDAASCFNQGFITVEYLAAALLDLDWASIKEKEDFDVNKFEKDRMDELGLIPEILPRYRSTYFGHVFSGDGYSAGYYVYIWAAVLDADAYNAFVETENLYNLEVAAAFRNNILAGSGKGEGMDQYRKFRGKNPDPQFLMKKRGFVKK